jgi:hypothetical protein
MKIVGAPAQNRQAATDFQRFLAETSRQHFNGNVAKAKALGANIVSAFSYRAAPEELVQVIREAGVEPTETVLRQVRFLSVFAAELSLFRYVPTPFLAEIAKSEMFDVLMRFSHAFYDDLARSGAFSFYYMALENGTASPARVGEQFALLCGAEGSAAHAALGGRLFETDLSVFRKAIRAYVFV